MEAQSAFEQGEGVFYKRNVILISTKCFFLSGGFFANII